MNKNKNDVIDQRVKEEYKYGFVTNIESDRPNKRALLFNNTVKQGDALLNRV